MQSNTREILANLTKHMQSRRDHNKFDKNKQSSKKEFLTNLKKTYAQPCKEDPSNHNITNTKQYKKHLCWLNKTP